MAANQRRKRLNGASIVSYGSREQHRVKRKNLGLVQNDLGMRSHISVEWDGNQKRVVAKREQIGIIWRHMKPFAGFVSSDHKVLADVLTIPQEIFDLDNLSEVLSYEVWKTHLSENERNLLMQFLPRGLEPHQVVEELLAGNNFHFGNPFLKWGASLCLGDLHPDVIVDREQHLKSEKRAYHSQLHNYHNDLIGFLVKLKERWKSCKDPEKEIVQKIWRSKNDVEKRVLSNVNESRVYDQDGNFTVTSESCSWDAGEKGCSSDNQIFSLRKDGKLHRRVLEVGIGKGKSTNSVVSLDDMLNLGERVKKGEGLPKQNIHSSDGDKYMSCIKISKQQHELVKSMKHGRNIQSRSLNSVLGNLDNIHVQPYEVFVKEEQKKLHDHWLQLVNKSLPAAYANWTEAQRQRHAVRNSLVAEVKDKSNPLIEEEDNVSSGGELQDKDENNMSSGGEDDDEDENEDEDEDNRSLGGELQDPDEDNVSSGCKLQDQDEDNVSSENELQDQAEDGVQNDQSSWKDDEVSIVRSREDLSPHDTYVSGSDEINPVSLKLGRNTVSPHDSYVSGSDEFNPTSMKLEKNIVLPKPEDASPTKAYVSGSDEINPLSLKLERNTVSPHDSYVSGSDEFSMKLEKNIVLPKPEDASPTKANYSRNLNTRNISINEGPPFNSGGDVWQAVEMPHSFYDSAVTHEYTASGLSLENPQVSEEERTCLIDLEADLRRETGKELINRQFDDASFSSYQSRGQSDLLQSFFKGHGVLPYHHEQKGPDLDLQASNNVIIGGGQFSSHFKEPLQTSQTLDQGQRRANEVYMPENMSQSIYPNGGRYLVPKQDQLVPRQDPLTAVNMTDWTANTARAVTPSQSHLDTGDFSSHHWFPADHQVRGGDWNGSDGSSLSSHSLGAAMNSDQSLFSILSQCNQLRTGGSNDSIRNTDQFLARRTYGVVDAGTSRTNAVAPQASHPPSGLVTDDMAWMSLPHPNSTIHDQMGKPYLRSWNPQ